MRGRPLISSVTIQQIFSPSSRELNPADFATFRAYINPNQKQLKNNPTYEALSRPGLLPAPDCTPHALVVTDCSCSQYKDHSTRSSETGSSPNPR